MRLTRQQLEKAVELQQEGKSMGQIAYKYHVHESTMRRYIRNFERYGASPVSYTHLTLPTKA